MTTLASFYHLNVPYKSQLDNWHNPSGSCNVTSLAMCLEFLKAERNSRYFRFEQFEDELYQYALDNNLSRHDPQDLAKIVRAYGCCDNFKDNGNIEEVKEWLAGGNPCVTHGYFTSFGHIIVIVGYDDGGFIVHDPYGEWFASGYRTDLTGAFLHYSYNLIWETCIPDGKFWVHFINKQ
ncbi:C39 family peptidase [Microcoleus sp. FACHB-672]|nr:C39 family peptidase [Microcoleus sp. FACHB-672]